MTTSETPSWVRADTLPEGINYRDTGCPDLNQPSCLECTRDLCRYDDAPLGRPRVAHHAAVRAMSESGRMSVSEIADMFGISARSVYRIRKTAPGSSHAETMFRERVEALSAMRRRSTFSDVGIGASMLLGQARWDGDMNKMRPGNGR